jgi:ABC-type multidrug transport system fused ATPase/permease subunit
MRPLEQLWSILSAATRREAVQLLCIMAVGMVLETAGVGVIVPVLALVSDPSRVEHMPALQPVVRLLGSPSPATFVAYTLIGLIVFYAVKSAFLAFGTWRMASFGASVQSDVSQRLYETYLAKPWTFHLQRNSALLIHNVTQEVSMLNNGCTWTILLVAELLVTGAACNDP